jgi:hypothetical protein
MKSFGLTMFLVLGLSKGALAMGGAAPTSSSVQPQPLTYGYLPGVDLTLGKGFSLPQQDGANVSAAKLVCLENVKAIPNPNRKVSQGLALNERIVTSNQELKTALGIDEQMDASYLVFSGSSQYDFNLDDQIDEDSLNVVIQGSAQYGPDDLDMSDVKLAPFAQQLVDQKRFDEFKAECGSQFVSELKYGTMVSLIISIHHLSDQMKESLQVQLSGSGGIGPFSGSAKTALSQVLTSSSASSNVSMNVVIRGGDGLSNLTELVSGLLSKGQDVAQIESGISSVFNALTPDKAAVIGFTTNPYPLVPWDEEDLMSELKQQMLSRIVENYRYEFERYNAVQELFDEYDRSAFLPSELVGIPDVVIDSGRAEMPALEKYILSLAETHATCMKDQSPDLSECEMPPLVPTPDFNALYGLLPPQ